MNRPVPRFASGGLVLSYACSAACAHCLYACTPKWTSGWIAEEALDALLRQLARSVVPAPGGPEAIGLGHGLHFTGGEPFLKFDLLARAVEKADALGIPSLFVETNAFWARKDDETREKLEHLKAKGLRGILISVNPFYLEFVPFALEGRFERFFPKSPAARLLDGGCQPPFLRPWHNHVDPDGNYMPGFCGGITLGDARRLDRLVRDGIDVGGRPVLGFLLDEDLRGLLGFAAERGYREREAGYFSRCHLCADVRRHLVRGGDFPELRPREFYAHLG